MILSSVRLASILAWAVAFGGFELVKADELPQAQLPTISLTIADKKLSAEVADEEAEREKGMMFRKAMADGTAMLFVLEQPQRAAFWMRNTLVPLSVAYLNPGGMIMEIHDLRPRDERPVASQFDTISYAIEVPQGWFTRNGILPGVIVSGLPPLAR